MFRISAIGMLLPCLALTLACRTDRPTDPAYGFGLCEVQGDGQYEPGPVRALHVPMRDGVRIAGDIVLPKGLPPGARLPTIITMTRYWRAQEGDGPNELARFYTRHGYAFFSGDVRGTGASFGIWRHSRSRDETNDFGEIVSWIVDQPWSDGTVGATGTSYAANTSDWIAASRHPAVKVIVPRSPDFDLYPDIYFPGGILHAAFGEGWGQSNKDLDMNLPRSRGGGPPKGVRPVDADEDGSLLAEAVQARADAPSVHDGLKQVIYADDVPTTWGTSLDETSIHRHLDALEGSGAAMLTWGSWWDAGTASGVLHRFMALDNPQLAVIGPWSHGMRHHASPYRDPDIPNDPSRDVQSAEDVCFFDRYLRGAESERPERLLVYYTGGEERWKTTEVWPPEGSTTQRLYMAADHALVSDAPEAETAGDSYTVDFDATTGLTNRWHTQWNGGDVVYPDRAEADGRLLVYTSEPLEADLEITGHPIVTLYVTSTATDGAFFVYLEDVDPSGRVTYVTEGQLRALHRKVSAGPRPYTSPTPYHSFMRKDGELLVPGQVAEVSFGLLPTSVLVKAGHRIRVAIAGADKDTFARVPDDGTPVITVARNREHASHIDLPIVDRQRDR